QVVNVYSWSHKFGRTVIAPMHHIGVKRRNARVFQVTLDDGSSFRATDDHLIMLKDGSYRQLKDLKAGDALNPFHSQVRQVVSAVFSGVEDVYDGTVDEHHNFAIITS